MLLDYCPYPWFGYRIGVQSQWEFRPRFPSTSPVPQSSDQVGVLANSANGLMFVSWCSEWRAALITYCWFIICRKKWKMMKKDETILTTKTTTTTPTTATTTTTTTTATTIPLRQCPRWIADVYLHTSSSHLDSTHGLDYDRKVFIHKLL